MKMTEGSNTRTRMASKTKEGRVPYEVNSIGRPTVSDFRSAEAESQYSLFDIEVSPEKELITSAQPPAGDHSNFVVYVDESGDHSLKSIDENYPIFVLAFCIFYKRHYSEKVVPALEKFKFNNFGHDIVIMHERDIRKEIAPFKFSNAAHKNAFIANLTDIIDRSNFIMASCIIDKRKLVDKGADIERDNPYHIALGFCLEALHEFLKEKGQAGKKTHIVFECRGKKEDKDLELEFRRVCDGNNKLGKAMPFEIILADKRSNSTGLQLADLVARPIGMNYLRPTQQNRAFDVLKLKFYCSGGRQSVGSGFEDWGLKVFPTP